MKFFGQILAVLFVLALLAALGGGGYFALKSVGALFSKTDSQVAAVIVIASAVALLAAKIIQTLSHMTRTEQPLFSYAQLYRGTGMGSTAFLVGHSHDSASFDSLGLALGEEVSMKKTQTVAAIILITGIVALIIIALIGGIRFSVGSIRLIFGALDPQIGVILGVACLVALLCAWIIAAAVRSAKQREIQSRIATERVSLYKEVLESLQVRMSGAPDRPPDLGKALLLKASTPVLKEYRLLLSMLSDVNAEVGQINQQLNRLVLAMRRDSGLSTYGLENEDCSRWLRDPASIPRVPDNGTMRKPHLGVQSGGVAHRL
jgi:hypothetical protein